MTHNDAVRQQADAINRYQTNQWLHPLTCGNPARTQTHILAAVVTADKDGVETIDLRCPICGWQQKWIPLIDYVAAANYRFSI